MPATEFSRELVTSAKGQYKCRVFNADGSRAFEHDKWLKNLILDSGLDKIAYMPWAMTFQFCVAGTGTTPTKVVTASNASQTGSVVSITAGSFSFTSNHVGKLIYWPATNNYARITAFTNTTTVSVNVSQTVASSGFEIFNVDQTTLVTPYSMCMRYHTGEGMCGTIVEGDTVSMFRTFDFYVESSPVQITELGFKESPAVETLFSRVLLPDPIFLAAGQWLQVSYQLSIRLAPAEANGKAPDVLGWPIAPATTTTGTEQIQKYGIAVVDNNGLTRPYDNSHLCNEPFAPGTNLLGPSYGYPNRWQNGAGSPTKLYTRADRNPFINPINAAEKYFDAYSKSYIPIPVDCGNMQWSASSLRYTAPQAGSSEYVFTSDDVGSMVRLVSGGTTAWLRISAAGNRSVTVTPSYWVSGGELSGTATLYFRSSEWGAELENVADCMQPIVVPPQPQVTRVSGIVPGWNGIDPQSYFPNPVPDIGLAPWKNWQIDFAPASITPQQFTLTANPQNHVSPTYQWQELIGDTWTDIATATASTVNVSAYDLMDVNDSTVYTGEKRYRVVLNGDDTQEGNVAYYTLTAIRPNPTSPTYYVLFTNNNPAVRCTGNGGSVISGDGGSNGRCAIKVEVYRDTTPLSVSAYSSSTFPGLGRFSMTDNNAFWSISGNLIYKETSGSGANTPTEDQYAKVLTVKIETSTTISTTWNWRRISNATASTPVVDISSDARVALTGGGLVDVCGASAFISEANEGPAPIGTTVDRSQVRSVELPLVLQQYQPGSFTRVKQVTFLTNMANGTNWRTIGIGPTDPDTQVISRTAAAENNGYVFVFDEPQTKLRTHYLSVFFRYTWNRDLSQ